MSLPVYVVSHDFAVAAQLAATDMQAVADAGYKSVIINRPDFEGGPDQPASEDVMRAARQAGLQVEYQPVISGALTPEDARSFAQMLAQLPRPVLAYCRSGGRCMNLYQMACELEGR